MANFLGKRVRAEFNGHDVSHLTGVSIGTMGKVFDTYQTLHDAFDHDIEITEEASGSFDFIADDAASGDQRFKEIMAMTTGFSDLADGGDGGTLANGDTSDTVVTVDEDWTNPDNQVNYTGSRFTTVYKLIADADASIAFDHDTDSIWTRFKAQGENIDTVAFAMTSTGGTSTHNYSMTVDIFDELSFGNVSMGETAALASAGSTTTLRDSGILTAADNSFIGATIKFMSGANAGLTRTISDSDSSDAEVTWVAALPTAVASGDQYMIYGAPSNTAKGSFAEITFTVTYDNFNGANKWRVLSSTDLGATWTGGDELTIGKYYWLRLYRSGSAGNTGRVRITTAANEISTGHLHLLDQATSPLADSYVANSEAVHYIKYKSSEGLKVVVYDYTDNSETNGVKWTFNKVKLDSVTPSFASKQATRASVSWKCNDWSFDAI